MASTDVKTRIIIEGDTAGVVQALSTAQKQVIDLESGVGSLSGKFTSLGGIAQMAGGAMGGMGLAAISQQLMQAAMSAERLRLSFEAATGSAASGAAAYKYAREEAGRLGLNLETTADAYLKLTAAAKGTALEGRQTEMIFSSVAGASRALGLSGDQMQGALLAVQQMMSKGTVQAEELRGQLGERLPGAFQIAARSMGVNTSELGKMLEGGKVLAEDFLPKFAAELEKTFPAGAKAVSGLTAETERLKTSLFELKVAVMNSGIDGIATTVIRGTTDMVNAYTSTIDIMVDETKLRVQKFNLWYDQNTGNLKNFMAIMRGESPTSQTMSPRDYGLKQAGLSGLIASGSTFGTEDNLVNQARRAAATPPAYLPKSTTAKPTTKDVKNYTEYNPGFMGWRSEQELSKSESEYITSQVKMGEQATRDWQDWNSDDNKRRFEEEQRMIADQNNSARIYGLNQQASAKSAEMGGTFLAMQASQAGNEKTAGMLMIDKEEQYWRDNWAMKTSSLAEYEARNFQITEYYAEKRKKIEQDDTSHKLGLAKSGFSSMATIADSFYQLSGKKSKAAFQAYKVLKSGETIITTADTAMKAYNSMAPIPFVGPALGIAAAAAAIASGMVQLQTINSASPDGGGSISNISGGAAPSSPGTQPVTQPIGSSQTGTAFHITMQINGSMLADQQQLNRWTEDYLVPTIRDLKTRGVNA